jgi:hypothetical protein
MAKWQDAKKPPPANANDGLTHNHRNHPSYRIDLEDFRAFFGSGVSSEINGWMIFFCLSKVPFRKKAISPGLVQS